MKNLIVTLSAILMLTTFYSCKRSFTCTCQSSWTRQWYDTDVKATTKRKAKKECTDKISPEVDGPSNCKLK